jgi:DnaK suppressor protein
MLVPVKGMMEMATSNPLKLKTFEEKLRQDEIELIDLLDRVNLTTEESGRALDITHELQRHISGLRNAQVYLSGGNYGVCAGCGLPIQPERLRANPRAVRCVGCQSVNDRSRH